MQPQATVVKKKVLTPDLVIMWLKPNIHFAFQPGQYCTLGIRGIERPYSIASAPHEEFIEFFLEVVPKELETEKSLSPKLYDLSVGDTVSLRPTAKGKFLLEEHYPTQVMVSTTTCIAPYISMARAYLAGYYKTTFPRPLYLFHGASYQDEFGYLEELRTAEKTGKIMYIPTVSRSTEARNASWKGKTGRVNVILSDYLKKLNILPQDSLIYLCGNKKMIAALGNKNPTPEKPLGSLIEAGFKTKEEIFF